MRSFFQFFSNNVTIYFVKHWICYNISCWVIVTL